ncbi:hypothetical protein A1D31_37685 [Bradyrhizobium liaoningense]|nr:hypothetical protein A1D31_37685 [Bradyrhizobium liaoningense]
MAREASTLLLLMRVLSFRHDRRESALGQRLRVANDQTEALLFASVPTLLRRGMQIAMVTEPDLTDDTRTYHRTDAPPRNDSNTLLMKEDCETYEWYEAHKARLSSIDQRDV